MRARLAFISTNTQGGALFPISNEDGNDQSQGCKGVKIASRSAPARVRTTASASLCFNARTRSCHSLQGLHSGGRAVHERTGLAAEADTKRLFKLSLIVVASLKNAAPSSPKVLPHVAASKNCHSLSKSTIMLLKTVQTRFIASILGATFLLASSPASATEATYDPIEAVVALAIVHSGNLSSLDVAVMRDVSFQGLYSSGGFIDHLKRVRGVSEAQLAAYRRNIVTDLGHASLGHGRFINASNRAMDDEWRMTGGRAFSTLLTAANGAIKKEYVVEAFNAMQTAMNSSRPPELAPWAK